MQKRYVIAFILSTVIVLILSLNLQAQIPFPFELPPEIRREIDPRIDPELLPELTADNWGFEIGLYGWEKTGTAFDNQPTLGNNVVAPRIINPTNIFKMPLGGDYWRDVSFPVGHKRAYWIGTYESRKNNGDRLGTIQGDAPIGTLTSKAFTLNNDFITFLIGGGNDIARLKIELLERVTPVSGGASCSNIVTSDGMINCPDGIYRIIPGTAKTGMVTELMRRDWWDVRSQRGKTLRIRITDNSDGPWGHINIDDIQFQDTIPSQTKVTVGRITTTQVRPYVFRPFRRGETLAVGFVDWDMPIWGVTDLHTHPMSHLAFGKKLIFGQPDGDLATALGNCNSTHGGWGLDNSGGNYIRALLVNQTDKIYQRKTDLTEHPRQGYPNFADWPAFTSVTHQQMHHEWIKRAYDGGLRVMVALAVNNHLLAEAIDGDEPKDDKSSADLQISEMKAFVSRHSDFMEIATDPVQLRDIVQRNKLAVVLGVEVDDLGNFNYLNVPESEAAVRGEIQRLFSLGVRYLFPIHFADNKFGGAAVYETLANLSNRFSAVQPLPEEIGAAIPNTSYEVEQAPDPQITYRLKTHLEELASTSPGSGASLMAAIRSGLEIIGRLPVAPNPCSLAPEPISRGICCSDRGLSFEVIAQLSSQSVSCEVRAREIASKAEMPWRLAVLTSERT